jgi:hypothetical protein
MCRNIHPLFNFKPKATDAEIEAASIQYVRKVSGFQKPSVVNQKAFNNAVLEVSKSTRKLVDVLKTDAKPKNREEEAQKARERFKKRYG